MTSLQRGNVSGVLISDTGEECSAAEDRHLQRQVGDDGRPVPPARKKTTGVGGEECGYDGDKRMRGRRLQLLLDTEGFVLKVKAHSAKVVDQGAVKLLLERAGQQFLRPSICSSIVPTEEDKADRAEAA